MEHGHIVEQSSPEEMFKKNPKNPRTKGIPLQAQ